MKTILILFNLLIIISNLYSQWTLEVQIKSGNSIEYLSVVDTSNVWAVGYHYSTDSTFILRRTSYTNWIFFSDTIISHERVGCIAAQDSNTVWIGTYNGKIYYTSNLGYTWNLQVNTGGDGFINDIKFSRTNRNYGYANSDPPSGAGTPFKIYKTVNGGLNWITFSPVFGGSYIGAYKSSCVTDSNHYWMGLNCQPSFCGVPKIAFTTNGGMNWVTSSIPNGSNYVSTVIFRSDNIYGITTPWDVVPVYMYRSNNGGNSWSFIYNTNLNQPVECLSYVEGTSVWYFCSSEINSPVYKSKDNGNSWYPMPINTFGEQLVYIDAIKSEDKIFAWSITLQGKIFKLIDTAYVIGINSNQSDIPSNFRLYQNYPNPFNPSTIIRYDIPKAGFVVLKVFDALGREAATLVNQEMKPGSYEAVFDGMNIKSGVYFYELLTGQFQQTRKMVLIR